MTKEDDTTKDDATWSIRNWGFDDDYTRKKYNEWSDQDLMIQVGETTIYELQQEEPDLLKIETVTKECIHELVRRDCILKHERRVLSQAVIRKGGDAKRYLGYISNKLKDSLEEVRVATEHLDDLNELRKAYRPAEGEEVKD